MKFIKWLTQYNKFLVALTMAAVFFINQNYGVDLGISETEAASFWMFISAILTFLIPNKSLEDK